jgi:inositol transport system ATP-binding protein
VGAGRTELVRAIFGADPIAAGNIRLDGRAVVIRSPRDAIRLGIALVPEDRKRHGLFLQLPVRQNFSVAALGRYLRGGIFVDERREERDLLRICSSVSVRMTGPEQPVAVLSGGNQQKVILARWLALNPRILLVDEPTRGIDIGAKAEVHEVLVKLAETGTAVLVVSSELPEVMAISDRIVTLSEGRVTGEFNDATATEEALMACMTPRTAYGDASVDKAAA